MQLWLSLNFGQKGRVLFPVLLAIFTVVRAQIFARALEIGSVPGDGIQFVIAHDYERCSSIHHAAHSVDGAHLRRAISINEVAYEEGLPPWVAPGTGRVAIAEFAQQCFQLFGLAVDVPNYVVRHALAPM